MHPIINLFIEALGWLLTIAGAYYVFGDNPAIIHYISFVAGIVIILLFFPYRDFKQKK